MRRVPGEVGQRVAALLRRRHEEREANLLADAMQLGALAGGGRPEGELGELARAGERAWKAGDIACALSLALAVREHAAEDAPARRLKQQALIAFATYARNLGKFRLARQMADDLLRQRLDRGLLVDVLVLSASIWRGLGSLEGAHAMIERAAKRVDRTDEARLARVEHQWAELLLESKKPEEAEARLTRAIALYRSAQDPYNEIRARILQTEVVEAMHGTAAALQSARDVLLAAVRHDFGRLKAFAHLELGRLLLACGEHDQAVMELHRGLGSAVLLADGNAELRARARLFKAYTALGQRQVAAQELRQVAELAERVDEVSEEIDEVLRQAATPRRSRREPATMGSERAPH